MRSDQDDSFRALGRSEPRGRLAPPLCPIQVAPSDFSQSAELIDRARASTIDWLHAGHTHTGQAVLLGLHRHAST
jgi:hypothetical protein